MEENRNEKNNILFKKLLQNILRCAPNDDHTIEKQNTKSCARMKTVTSSPKIEFISSARRERKM